jgi:hypothetical protein
MGLCFPKQCSIEEVRGFTEDLIKGYAQGVGWTDAQGGSDITIDYR